MKKIIFTLMFAIFFTLMGSYVFADNGFVISIKSVDTSQNSYTPDIEISNYSGKPFAGVLIVALYDEENKLIGINTSEETIASKENKLFKPMISTNDEVKYMKIFLWNNINNMQPVCSGFDTSRKSFLKSIEDLQIYVDYVELSGGGTAKLDEPAMRIRFRGTMEDKDNIHEVSMKVLDSDNKIIFIDQASCIEGEFCSSFMKAVSTGTYRLMLAGETPGENEEIIFHIKTLKP